METSSECKQIISEGDGENEKKISDLRGFLNLWNSSHIQIHRSATWLRLEKITIKKSCTEAIRRP